MKTWKEAADAIRNGHSIVVQFRKPIEEQEGYLEAGMRGKLTAFTEEDDTLVKFTVDLTDFDVYNRSFESTNYYDASGNPTLTAREAGYYPKNHLESMWVDENASVGEVAEILTDEAMGLYNEYLAASVKHIPYPVWLETQIKALRQGLPAIAAKLEQSHPNDWGVVVAQSAQQLKDCLTRVSA